MFTQTNRSQSFSTKGSFTRGKRNELMILFGIVPESFPRCPFSVVAALGPSAQDVANRSRHSIDDVSKFEGASLKSMPDGKMALALAAVRHQKSSPFHLSSRTDAIRCPRRAEPRPGIGRPIAKSRCPGEKAANGSTTR